MITNSKKTIKEKQTKTKKTYRTTSKRTPTYIFPSPIFLASETYLDLDGEDEGGICDSDDNYDYYHDSLCIRCLTKLLLLVI